MEKLSLSTKASTSAQFDEFRELFGRTILRIDIDPLGDRPFQSEAVLQRIGDAGLLSGSATPAVMRHKADLIDNDDLVLVFLEGGRSALDQHGRRTEYGAGAVVLTSNGEPATMTVPEPIEVFNLRLSRNRLVPNLANLGDMFLAPRLRDGAALRLLQSYTRALVREVAFVTPALEQVAADHLYDLAALALGATPDAAAMADRGIRAARLQAIKAYVLDHLTSPRLSAEIVARRNGISESYLRRLFAEGGTSFTDFVLDERLALVHRKLVVSRLSMRPIGEIAFECGFSDLSYFNRAFRRRYGMTPSEVRANARW